MDPGKNLLVLALTAAMFSGAPSSHAQSSTSQTVTPIAASAPTAVPALVPYSGTVIGETGKDLSTEIATSFLIYKDEQGGEPLWTETQTVNIDPGGHYKVQLGATSSNGLPSELFSTGDARWLEVQVAGQPPEPRVLLASVPYAMKASDASTLGGLPASAFALAGTRTPANAASMASENIIPDTASTVTTSGGTSGYLPMFTGSFTIADSIVFQNTLGIGIGDVPNAALDVNGKAIFRGAFQVARIGNATKTAGVNSNPFSFFAQAYDSAKSETLGPSFSLQSEAIGNNTPLPGATLNLLYDSGLGSNAETGDAIGGKYGGSGLCLSHQRGSGH